MKIVVILLVVKLGEFLSSQYSTVTGYRETLFEKCKDRRHVNQVISTYFMSKKLHCAALCSASDTCASINVCRHKNQITCQLSTFYPTSPCSGLEADVNCSFLYMKNRCRNNGVYTPYNGVYTPSNGTCTCSKPYVGDLCDRIAYNCQELYDTYTTNYMSDEIIQPVGQDQILNVTCGSGALVAWKFLFYSSKPSLASTWEDFRYHRADTNNKFAGTEALHVITNSQPYDLKIWLNVFTVDPIPMSSFVYYRGFRVNSEQENYTFEYDSFDCVVGCSNVIDGLATVSGEPFSTTDRDVYNCVNASGHCWWFNSDCGPVSPSYPEPDQHPLALQYAPTWPRNVTFLNHLIMFVGYLHVV